MATDVYAFGCLYYSVSPSFYYLALLIRLVQIFFNTVPFGKDCSFFRVSWLVVNGKRPGRLETPKMSDKTWKLVESCWKPEDSERPRMEGIELSIRSSLSV